VIVRSTSVRRALLTAVLCVSWNVTTTHCAFAAATAAAPAIQADPDECPMHAAQKQAPQPAKKKGCGDLLCCKSLPAAKPAAPTFASKAPPAIEAAKNLWGDIEKLIPSPASEQLLTLDTGPPRPNILTEVILRRSIPAHAPPSPLI